ncbi:MAG: hypothetical protein KDG89_03370 [Geminicoccaceae bacterium]|nr:hypothetical protein [Geminicoccaceae bacterium]
MELSERVEALEMDVEHLRVEAYVLRNVVAALAAGQGEALLRDTDAFVEAALDRLKGGGGAAHAKPVVDPAKAKAVAADIKKRAGELTG